MQNNFIVYVKSILVMILFILFLGLGIQTSRHIPDNAKVYLNTKERTYIGLPSAKNAENLKLSTIKEAKSLHYKASQESADNGDFYEDDRSLTGLLFEKVGLLNQLPSRWNKDGTWNW